MKKQFRSLWQFTMLLLLASIGWAQAKDDSLYVSDYANNNVRRFDAVTGADQGVFAAYTGSPTAVSPTGLIFDHSQHALLVNFQNANTPYNGQIDKFNDKTGEFEGVLVPASDPNSPVAPYGILVRSDIAYVATIVGPNGPPGTILAFDADLGNLLASPTFVAPDSNFLPLGEVIGPDGLLYVASGPSSGNVNTAGRILVFNPKTGVFIKTFTDSNGCGCNFRRPTGTVFGPDGNLYVTSVGHADANGNTDITDKIFIIAGPRSKNAGAVLDHIDLDQIGGARTFAAFLLFGPKGKLFVPIFNTGEVRSYDVKTKTYTSFVPASTSPLIDPFGLTFGNTDPVTLAYGQ